MIKDIVNKLAPLIIGDLKIPIPIIQGGMGVRVSTASLAAAVANYGGAGTIASVGLGTDEAGLAEKDYIQSSRNGLINEIEKARELSNGAIGVNILVALSNFEDLARTAAQKGADYIIAGAGLPIKLPEFVKGTKTKIIPIVSSARLARLMIKSWTKKYSRFPDAIVVEGPLAGGHVGFSPEDVEAHEEDALERIVKEVLEVTTKYEKEHNVSIPVIAAGGIFDGKDIARFLKMGAKGVQLGTRFVATNECSVPDAFKQKYVDAKEEDIVIIKSPVGLPGRTLRTKFIDELMTNAKKKIICRYKCLKTCDIKTTPYCIAQQLMNAVDPSTVEDAIVFAGHNVYKVKEIVPVKTLMDELVNETIACLNA
ncbi:MAG: nitronate monooxygenase [Kiritimatiellae bacterium]|jgi:nitronate monooxygenase|nr:nitronate monooxygenase [Kiritimatiellia bacterium]